MTTLQARLIAGLVLAAALIVGYALWHHHVWDAATAAADTRWEAKLAAAKASADAEQKRLQDEIDAQAGPSNATLHDQFAKLQATMDDMRKHPQNYVMPKPAKPLPADCKLDPAIVAQANEVLRQ